MKQLQSFIKSDPGGLLLAGLLVSLLHILANGQYGFHRDELDMIMNARILDWGYVAYPPLTPLLARISLEMLGHGLQAMRLFPALGQGVVFVLVGLMARDMGAGRAGQLFAGLAAAVAPAALIAGTMIQYMAIDYIWWVVTLFFFVRLIVSEDPRYWLGIGAGIGLGMMTKYTMVFLVAGLVVGVLLTSLRRGLRSPWLWAGVGLSLLIFLPNAIWQIQHQFISLDFLSAIHARDIAWGRTDDFIAEQFLLSANPFLAPVWIAGLIWLLFRPGGKRFRPVALGFLVTFGLLVAAQGRSYYLSPFYTPLMAGGVTWLFSLANRPVKAGLWVWLALATVVGVILCKPVTPIGSPLFEIASDVNNELNEMIGWDDLTMQIAGIYAGIPEAEKPGTVIFTGNYGEAGALDLYGPDYGLPRVISGSNSLWYRGYGQPEPQTVIAVGFTEDYLRPYFDDCDFAGVVSNRFGVRNEESSFHTGLYVCRQPLRPWAEMWAELQWFQ